MKSFCLFSFIIILSAAGILFLQPLNLSVLSSSMMPSYLGPHWDLLCPKCGNYFLLTVDVPYGLKVESVRFASCPNCGYSEVPVNPYSLLKGTSLRVSRFFKKSYSPKRWELSAFKLPLSGRLAFKRVAGLPGEKVQIVRGTLLVNGSPVSKPLDSWSTTLLPLKCIYKDSSVLLQYAQNKASLSDEEHSSGSLISPVTNQLPVPSLEIHSSEKIDYVNDFILSFESFDFLKEKDFILNQGDRFWLFRIDSNENLVMSRLDNPNPDDPDYFHSLTPESFAEVSASFPLTHLSGKVILSFRDFACSIYDESEKILFSLPNLPVVKKNLPISTPLVIFSSSPQNIQFGQFDFYRDIGWSSQSEEGSFCQLNEDEYFLLGDNTTVSIDSRDYEIPVKRSALRKIYSGTAGSANEKKR